MTGSELATLLGTAAAGFIGTVAASPRVRAVLAQVVASVNAEAETTRAEARAMADELATLKRKLERMENRMGIESTNPGFRNPLLKPLSPEEKTPVEKVRG